MTEADMLRLEAMALEQELRLYRQTPPFQAKDADGKLNSPFDDAISRRRKACTDRLAEIEAKLSAAP